MFSDCGRYVFSVLACMGNMICLLGRDSMRLAIIPMKNETQMSPEEVSHILGKIFKLFVYLQGSIKIC